MVKSILLSLSVLLSITSCTTAQTSEEGVFHENINIEKFEGFVNGDSGVVLDVRTNDEFADTHIARAQNVVYSMFGFEDEIKGLDKDETYYIHCRSGARSGRAMKVMKKAGFKRVYNMSGGLLAWQAAGKPVVK